MSFKSMERMKKLSNLKEYLKNNIDNLGVKWVAHLSLFLGAPEIARILWFNEMFLKVKDIPGIVVEFGSQFGASFNIFQMLKIIHEPWNPSRKLVSFTTFNKGLTNVNKKDGSMVEEGDYGVPQDWKEIFETILEINTTQSPVEPNYKIIEGDVSKLYPNI